MKRRGVIDTTCGRRHDTPATAAGKADAAPPALTSGESARAPPRGCGRRRARIPGRASSGTLRAGRMQRVKPIWAASRTRRPAWPAPRTSPPRPTSPKSTVCGGQRAVAEGRGDRRGHPEVGRGLVDLEAAGDAHEDVVAEQLQARPASRARRAAGWCGWGRCRATSGAGCRRRWARRAPAPRPASAASPRSWPPPPSPGAPAWRSARKSADGLATGLQAGAGHLEDARARETAPKRFFTARTIRWCWRFSPSK